MMMNHRATVQLPRGLWEGDRLHREAELRAPNGADEISLLEGPPGQTPAERSTAFLARCLLRLGSSRDVSAEQVRELVVGDREALLLHLRRLTFGDRLDCVVDCPAPGCGEKIDLEIRVGDLLVLPYEETDLWLVRSVTNGRRSYNVRFRLPNGGDLEQAARVSDTRAAALGLVDACVAEVRSSRSKKPLSSTPQAVYEQLPDVLCDLDSQAEATLHITCPVCDEPFVTFLDAGEFLYREVRARSGDLYREVHTLAFHYHWSEAEILGMKQSKRRRYLGLLAEAIEGGE